MNLQTTITLHLMRALQVQLAHSRSSMRRMEKKTRDVVVASSVIPDLSTAVQEGKRLYHTIP